MKIAVCISGQPRGLPNACDFILDNLIKPNNIGDIFIHTWYDKNMEGQSFDSAQPGQSGNLGGWYPNTPDYLISKLNPKKLLYEAPKSFDEFSHLQNRETAIQTRLASMFYSAYKANQLKQDYEQANHFKYDLVIKTRIDLFYNEPIILSNLIDSSLDQNIYVAEEYQYMRQNDSYPTKSGNKYSSMSDTFAFGTSENIDKLASLYENFEDIYNEIWPYAYGEAYLGYHVRFHHKLGISMKKLNYRIYR